MSLAERVHASIATDGQMPFEQFVDLALYDPAQGFYATHGRAGGRQGDFVTSVEAGPLFAAVIADWLDRAWLDAGRPARFHVSEVGAGIGTLFRGIHRAKPTCLDALVYTLVERSALMRVTHQSLPTELWRSADRLPGERQHAIVANELLDNLAFGMAEKVAQGWARVHVVSRSKELIFETGECDINLNHLDGLAPGAPTGARVPLAERAGSWIRAAQRSADRVLVFDYGATTAELVERGQPGWLRTYAAHARGNNPLIDVGLQDITHDVPFDQLPSPTSQMTQADWLQTNGLPERVATAREVWEERAHIGDLQAIAARSAVGEAQALVDPAGLGAFHVLEWSQTL